MNLSIEDYRLLIDFGMTVLIWMVQLLIYPSFKYFEKDGLIQWHRKYTRNMSFVVMPLMTAQMVLVMVQLYQNTTTYSIFSIISIIILWVLTFAYFVPLHQKIGNGKANGSKLQSMVLINWIRTLFWSLLFLGSIMKSIS